MSRAERGLSLLFSHDQKEIIGRAENIRIDPDRVMRGTLKFREGEYWDMVRDGDLQDVSIGYRVDKWEETEDGAIARNWTPVEVSMVAVPADSAAGIGRTLGDPEMPDPNRDEKIRQDAIKAEQKRCNDIRHHFSNLAPDQTELRDRCINDGLTFEESIRELSRVRQTSDDQTEGTSRTRAQATGADAEFQTAMSDWLEYRSGVHKQVKEDGTRNEKFWELYHKIRGSNFQGMRLADMARVCVQSRGVSCIGWNEERIFDEAFNVSTRAVDGPLNQTTTDFTLLLADQINKAVLTGWMDAPESWSQWAETGSAADFKQGSRVHVSNFSSLDEVPENTDYAEGRVDDFAEPFAVKTYGKLWSISRQAMINDDQSGLARVPRNMGRAAARKVGDRVYAVLTANGNMSDGNPLFDPLLGGPHNNNSTAAAAPDVDTIEAGRRAMRLQKDNNADGGNTMGLMARYIIVPLEYRNAARVAVRSVTLPEDHKAFGIINPIEPDRYVIVDDHRLSEDSPTKWYMAADTEQVEVVWLNGVSVPMLESQPNWKRDGLHYKIRLDFDVLPVDWRTLYRNGE